MHDEMGIASSVLDTVKTKAAQFPHSRPWRVGVTVGEWSGVDIESLRFCIESLARASDLEGLRVEIDSQQRRNQCDKCGWIFHVDTYDIRCPYCSSRTTTVVGGTETDVSFVEMAE